MERENLYIVVFCFMLFLALAAFANVNTTTVYWVVPAGTTHSVSYDENCSSGDFYFVSAAAEIGDQNAILPASNATADNNCQTADNNAISILNQGNVAIDVNISVVGTFTSGVFLKTWHADVNGCGTDASGGYEVECSNDGEEDANVPTTSTCMNILGGGVDVNRIVISGLPVNDTQGLCFAADFESVAQGTANQPMVTDSYAN